MLRLTFTEDEVKDLHYQRYHHPHPRVQMKMEAVLLKAKGVPHHQIALCVGVCENTIHGYLEQYQTGGIEALKRLRFHRPTSEMEAHHETLEGLSKAEQKRFITMMQKVVAARTTEAETAAIPN